MKKFLIMVLCGMSLYAAEKSESCIEKYQRRRERVLVRACQYQTRLDELSAACRENILEWNGIQFRVADIPWIHQQILPELADSVGVCERVADLYTNLLENENSAEDEQDLRGEIRRLKSLLPEPGVLRVRRPQVVYVHEPYRMSRAKLAFVGLFCSALVSCVFTCGYYWRE